MGMCGYICFCAFLFLCIYVFVLAYVCVSVHVSVRLCVFVLHVTLSRLPLPLSSFPCHYLDNEKFCRSHCKYLFSLDIDNCHYRDSNSSASLCHYLHPKTLFEIAMVLSTNSGSFPSNSHVSATFFDFAQIWGILESDNSWHPMRTDTSLGHYRGSNSSASLCHYLSLTFSFVSRSLSRQ